MSTLYRTFCNYDDTPNTTFSNISGLANWNTSKVTDMRGMFWNCTKLEDISSLRFWDISNVTNMRVTFACYDSYYNLISDIAPIANWNVSNIDSFRTTFQHCETLTDISALANWNVSNVTDMERMFYNCTNLTDISALANWNVSNVKDMYYMFAYCSNLITLDMSGWDTGKVTSTKDFLGSCSKLTTWKFDCLLVFIMFILGNCLFLKFRLLHNEHYENLALHSWHSRTLMLEEFDSLHEHI